MNKKIVLSISLMIFLSTALVYIILKGSYFCVLHDVAVVNVTPSETKVYVGNVIDIVVIVKNDGSQSETFNVTSYYNVTILKKQTVTNLAAGAQTSLTFNWNTTGVTPANYIIKAEASIVPNETDTSDNICFGGIVRVRRTQPAELARLYVTPSVSVAEVGQNFTIYVNISGVIDLYGLGLKLKWNSTLLNATEVSEGSFLKQGANTFFTLTINNKEGYVLADYTLLGDVPGVSGNGTLAAIQFYVKNTGECPLVLSDSVLVSSFEEPINCTAIDGYFSAT